MVNEPSGFKLLKFYCICYKTNKPAKTQLSLGICPVWSVFAVHMKKPWILSYLLSAQRRLIGLGGCPGWSEDSLGTHAILLILSCSGSYMLQILWSSCRNSDGGPCHHWLLAGKFLLHLEEILGEGTFSYSFHSAFLFPSLCETAWHDGNIVEGPLSIKL